MKIRFLVMDVDGTLTDGKIYMGAQGELLKAFDIKDGYGIKEILPLHNITPVIITARSSEILQNRCRELGITELYQNTRDKFACLTALLERHHSSLAEVAYIGDDCLDLQCMEPVLRAGGQTGCPANAVPAVMAACSFVAPHKAGEGAVRDFVEYLVNPQSLKPSNPQTLKPEATPRQSGGLYRQSRLRLPLPGYPQSVARLLFQRDGVCPISRTGGTL